MERPKHRRLLLFVCVLLAGGMAFALGHQWTSTPDPIPGSAGSAQFSTRVPDERPSGNLPSTTVEAISANTSASSRPTPAQPLFAAWSSTLLLDNP